MNHDCNTTAAEPDCGTDTARHPARLHTPSADASNAARTGPARSASEGVIRFGYRMTRLAPQDVPPLAAFRSAHRRGLALGLLGRAPQRYDGLAFGNLSLRAAQGFWVTASQRIDAPELEAADLVLVTAVSDSGQVLCRGERPPSSETLTHAAVQFRARGDSLAVFHGHSPSLWRRPAADWSRSPPEAANGTRAMADAVSDAVAAAPQRGVLTMRGHEDGILAWAEDFTTIVDVLAAALAQHRA